MQFRSGTKSILFFMLSVIFLILLTLFEASLTGISLKAERVLSALLLVLPSLIGLVFGVLGILRKEPRGWVAILGVILNALFALFQTALISFAG